MSTYKSDSVFVYTKCCVVEEKMGKYGDCGESSCIMTLYRDGSALSGFFLAARRKARESHSRPVRPPATA